MDNWDCRRPIRLLGIGIANIDEDMPEQISIFDVNSDLPDEVRREERLEKAMDAIRSRFGSDKLKRAKLLDGGKKSK
jgi:DNA polymerase-4